MKRFSLNTRRANKVVALALVAALGATSLPARSSVVFAEPSTTESAPKADATESFDSFTPQTYAALDGKQLVIPDKNVTSKALYEKVSGGKVIGTFESVDPVVAKDESSEDGLKWEEFSVQPEVKKGAVGNGIALKDSVVTEKYPSLAPTAESTIQSAEGYYSGVEIANPFTQWRSELFDGSRYTTENIAKTASEVVRYDDLNWYHTGYDRYDTLRNRVTSPEAKKGVTISFWARVPYDEAKQAAKATSFFEFSNTETEIVGKDDLAKNYVAALYDEVKNGDEVLTELATDSPFYFHVATGQVVAVDKDAVDSYKNVLATTKAFAEVPTSEAVYFPYIDEYGMYMKWNEELGDSEAAYEDGNGYRVFVRAKADNNAAAKSKEVVIDRGEDVDASVRYVHLVWSDKTYKEGSEESNYYKFKASEEYPYGNSKVVKGATGILSMGSEKVLYTRDANTTEQTDSTNINTGVLTNDRAAEWVDGEEVKLKNIQSSAYAEVANPEVGETAVDEEWHFYTVSITDEWFQVYVDGEPCDPDQAKIAAGDGFNLGSGLFHPDYATYAADEKNWSSHTAGWQYDFVKFYGKGSTKNTQWVGDWGDSIAGYMFGTTVMDYITDPNTKLYVGGKVRTTAAGTLVDEFSFFKTKLSDAEVKALYDAQPEPQPVETAEVPEMVAEYALDAATEYTASPATKGKALKFTDATTTAETVWPLMSDDGVTPLQFQPGDADDDGVINTSDALAVLKKLAQVDVEKFSDKKADADQANGINTSDALAILQHLAKIKTIEPATDTFTSVDLVPETDDKGELVYEDIDATPTIVTDKERGNVLELKDSKVVDKYPSAASKESEEKVHAAAYYSGVVVENPFAALRDDLFDASRYTTENIANTASEVVRYDNLNWYKTGYDRYDALRNHVTSPEAKTGVTISFWAKVPVDEAKGAAAVTSFFEFSNTETEIVGKDDLAKNYVAALYDKVKESGADLKALATDSPFYFHATSGKVVAVDKDAMDSYKKALGTDTDFAEGQDVDFPYIDEYGMYMKWNEELGNSEAAYEDGNGYRVFVRAKADNNAAAKSKEVVIDRGEDVDASVRYVHLVWSDRTYIEGSTESNYAKFKASDEYPYGNSKVVKGATGILSMGSEKVLYTRDANATTQTDSSNINTGVLTNDRAAEWVDGEKVKLKNIQSSAYAEVANPEVGDAAADEEWHYYTVSITDEWFQVYVDGEACDPEQAKLAAGDGFNLGSGLFHPDFVANAEDWSKHTAGWQYDFVKFYGKGSTKNTQWLGDWGDSIAGYMFGTTVMDYITDANTKLYIGGKTQTTAAGTLIDDMAFYAEPMNAAQAKAEFEARNAE